MEDKQKKQNLGIFYTDPAIAEFVFQMLSVWKADEDSKTGRWSKRGHNPSVIDPAVGEGVFLNAALEGGFTKPDWVFGLDFDADVVKRWPDSHLSEHFESDAQLAAHFFHQNGLDEIHWHQHAGTYRYKLKQADIKAQQFDVVVGNPPFGGTGLQEDQLTPSIVEGLASYQVLPEEVRSGLRANVAQSGLALPDMEATKTEEKKLGRLVSFPIEILFLERFIKLAKPGGWIAVVLPDGVLANSRVNSVREYVAGVAQVEAIISLPRDAFRNAGTSAKTSILFLRRSDKPDPSRGVFLASVSDIDKETLGDVANSYKVAYNNKMPAGKVKIFKDGAGKETAIVRADKTLRDLMGSEASSRWDPDYWHPKFDRYVELFNAARYETKTLGELKDFYITTGSGSKRIYTPKGGVKYIQNINVRNTGIDFSARLIEIREDSEIDRQATRVLVGDIVFNRSGVGTLGRAVCVNRDLGKANISNDVYLIRNAEINQFYLTVYLMTEIGHEFVDRESHGVSGLTKINTDDIKKIPIPILSANIQKRIEAEYREMSAYHAKAVEARNNNRETEYEENIGKAEEMLQKLTATTEALICAKP